MPEASIRLVVALRPSAIPPLFKHLALRPGRAIPVAAQAVTLAMMLPCESITPLGRPAVPDV